MNIIIPAIIPQSLDYLRDALLSLEGVAHEIQIDIVDGSFVKFTSWPYRGSGSVMLLREFSKDYALEVDLMIDAPEIAIPLYVDAGVSKVVVHLESATDLKTIYDHHNTHPYELGLSIRNDTPIGVLLEELPHADYVQLMGIREIGSQGQPFDTEVLSRIHEIREAYPDMVISIDGSVNKDTLRELKSAGANRFVAGSAIFGGPEPSGAYTELVHL